MVFGKSRRDKAPNTSIIKRERERIIIRFCFMTIVATKQVGFCGKVMQEINIKVRVSSNESRGW
jgi:hypothetical protein